MRSSSKNLEQASVNLFKLKDKNSRISYFLILIFIACIIHKCFFSFSNWFPLALALWASSQVTNLSFFLSCANLLNKHQFCCVGLYFAVWELPEETTWGGLEQEMESYHTQHLGNSPFLILITALSDADFNLFSFYIYYIACYNIGTMWMVESTVDANLVQLF